MISGHRSMVLSGSDMPSALGLVSIVSLFVWSSLCLGDCLFVVSFVHCKLSELHT